MKRGFVALLSLLLGLSLLGCAPKEIKGTPSHVVQKCQYVDPDWDVTVTVTGHVVNYTIDKTDDGEYWVCNLAESSIDTSDGQVCCLFKDKPITERFKTFSVTGKVKVVLPNYVMLKDCKAV